MTINEDEESSLYVKDKLPFELLTDASNDARVSGLCQQTLKNKIVAVDDDAVVQ